MELWNDLWWVPLFMGVLLYLIAYLNNKQGTSIVIGIVATMIPAGREAYFRSSEMFLAYLFCWAIILFSIFFIVRVNSVEGDDTKK